MRSGSWIAFCVFTLLWHVRASADWLSLRGTCPGTSDQVAQRVERELAGERPAGLSVTLELEAGESVHGALHLHAGARLLGTKRVVVRSCEEGLALLTAIAALTLSSFPEPAVTSRMAAQLPFVAPPPEGVPQRATHHPARRDGDGAPSRAAEKGRWLLLSSAGVTLDTASSLTLLVSGGGAMRLGPGKLRVFGRYGLPSTTEVIDAQSRSVRSDFGAVAVDYCYALDRGAWLSLCGGLEQQTKRERRAERLEEARHETSRRQAALLGHAGALLVLARTVVRPQLELSWLVPVWGGLHGSAFRAGLGAGLPF